MAPARRWRGRGERRALGPRGPANPLARRRRGRFVAREARRGRRYDGIVLDPPAFGRASGREWRLEEDLPALLAACRAIAADGAFVLLTAHSESVDGTRPRRRCCEPRSAARRRARLGRAARARGDVRREARARLGGAARRVTASPFGHAHHAPRSIDSPANPRVKAALRLRERRERDATGLTLVDGGREALRAMEAGAIVETAFVCPAGSVRPRRAASSRRSASVSSRTAPRSRSSRSASAPSIGWPTGIDPTGSCSSSGRPRTRLEDLVLPAEPLVDRHRGRREARQRGRDSPLRRCASGPAR